MNKSELLTRIRTIQNELNSLIDMVMALDEASQIVQVQENDSDDWLTVREVCRRMSISQTTFYEAVKNGLLPPGFAFGPKTKRWRMSDIRAWQASKQNRNNFAKSTSERQNTRKRRGRVSRIMKIGEFCHA